MNVFDFIMGEIESAVGSDNELIRLIAKDGKYKMVIASKDNSKRVIIEIKNNENVKKAKEKLNKSDERRAKLKDMLLENKRRSIYVSQEKLAAIFMVSQKTISSDIRSLLKNN